MKTKINKFLVLLFFVLPGIYANSFCQWQKLKLNDNLFVSKITVKGNKLFAGTHKEGIWVSSDYGENWKKGSDQDFSSFDITSMTVAENRIFAGTWQGSLFYSDDDGTEWKKAEFPAKNGGILALISRGTEIYAGRDNVNTSPVIYRSTDGGNSWIDFGKGFPADDACIGFTISGSKIFAASQYSGLYVFSDEAKIWKHIDENFGEILDIYSNPKYILISSRYSGIYFSEDNGTSWSAPSEDCDFSYYTFGCIYCLGKKILTGNFGSLTCFDEGKCYNLLFTDESFWVYEIIYLNDFLFVKVISLTDSDKSVLWRVPVSDIKAK